MADDKEPKKQQFNLKPIETQMLTTTQQQLTSILTNLLSFIAIERLNYNVTDRTMYEVSADAKTLRIFERLEETPQGEVKAATTGETAKAMKGKA